MLVFRVVTMCGLAARYDLQAPKKEKIYSSETSKRWYLLASLHRDTTQKTNTDIITAARTSNLTQWHSDT
jgi:hypothetical protein